MLKYFSRLVDKTAEAWSYFRLRSEIDMLRVCFSRTFVPSECDVNKLLP
jgi:hypothetical protein